MNTDEKQNEALAQFQGEFNCAQSVLGVYASELKMKREYLEKTGSAFGGGMGEGETCGAVTGALMVLGLKFGHSGSAFENKERIKQISASFKSRFEEKHGTLKCRDLIGYNVKNPVEAEMASQSGVFSSNCPEFIKSAISIIDDLNVEN